MKEFTLSQLNGVLERCNVVLKSTENENEIIPKGKVSWGPSDYGVDYRNRTIYKTGGSNIQFNEYNRFIVLHELAHIMFWTGLGVECPEGILIVWENRVLKAICGARVAMTHLWHPYTRSSIIRRMRGARGGTHLDLSTPSGVDFREQAWWSVAEAELDKMNLRGDISKLTQPVSFRKLKSAMIRVAEAQEFELPRRWEFPKKNQQPSPSQKIS